MILAETDEGFASCEEDDSEALEKNKRTGDPFLDFHLDLKKIKDEETRSNIYYLINRICQNWKRGFA